MKTGVLRLVVSSAAALLGIGIAAALPTAARAQDTATLTSLYSFDGTDGSFPNSLMQASDGNFYGTTDFGGFGYAAGDIFSGNGTVFQLTPAGVLTTLYVFAGADDGAHPTALTPAADGSFYGLTTQGGTGGYGTIFHVTPTGALTTLYSFASSTANPQRPLIPTSDGSLYGLTGGDRATDFGSVFQLTSAGVYSELYRFTNGTDGSDPSGLVLNPDDNNFYGSVISGGTDNDGTLFRLTPAGDFTLLHSFTQSDGAFPLGLALGNDGNFYGATIFGGEGFGGTLFRLTPAGDFTLLHSFTAGGTKGTFKGLVLGGDGNFYGINAGVVYRITPAGVFTGLYVGAGTILGIRPGSDGNLYGVDDLGAYNDGSVFKLQIVPHPAFFTNQAPLGSGVYYLAFANGNYFGLYAFLDDPNYLYHFDLGYEYVFDANDGKSGVYLYDFASSDFFYTSPSFPFPYLYDFGLNSVLYYYPDPNDAGHYNTYGVRYFYDFNTGTVISK